ncbi:MAG: gliding motility-associated ABC transporter permease subunit GldF [Saprospiraceae bacterium]|nr:gliding motility-associated ABC transporter permease subunit GldF [Saprospiraceae bacterium]
MASIFWKELNALFSSLIGYVVIAVFLLLLGLTLWVFPDYSILNYNYATLQQLFDIAPLIFLFLIPAITMRSFAEENQTGTIELLATRPISDFSIVLGKFLANLMLVAFALLPTVLYYYTVSVLGSPPGNIDGGAVLGSYLGLFLLGAVFTAIGIFSSSLTRNQIVAFVLGIFLCFIFYWGFSFISKMPGFIGNMDAILQKMGIEYHYASISRGLLDTRDLIYFLSVSALFLFLTQFSMERRKW